MNPFTWLFQEYRLIALKRQGGRDNPHPPASWAHGTKGNILLINGLHERWYFFKVIGDFLNALGYQIYTINKLENNTMPICDGLDIVQKYILVHKLEDLIIISHSKGGLIAAALLKSKIKSRIRKVITIATPFHGSVFAYLKRINAPELVFKSPFLLQLLSDLPVNKITNLYPILDNHVIPNHSLKLSGATNIPIPVFGHTRILDHPITMSIIQHELLVNKS